MKPTTPPALRILLVNDRKSRSPELGRMLMQLGYEVLEESELAPDVIVIDTDSPSRDTLKQVALLSERAPRPIVMFARDPAQEAIRQAVQAGVSAYVVDGIDAARVESIIDVARARFEEFQRLRGELAEARQSLSERKLVERAKGILMQRRGLSEEAAFAALRSMAMDRKARLVEAARSVIEAAQLLG